MMLIIIIINIFIQGMRSTLLFRDVDGMGNFAITHAHAYSLAPLSKRSLIDVRHDRNHTGLTPNHAFSQ